MAGIVFVRTLDLARIVEFYRTRVGMRLWLEQPDIHILRHENMLIGFKHDEVPDRGALLTFFYPSVEEVDRMYHEFTHEATTAPRVNDRYHIYNFFALDPDNRRIEFQCFLHELPPWR